MLDALRRRGAAMRAVTRFLEHVEEHARQHGREEAAVEDLVLAALDDDTDDSANRALTSVGVSATRLADAMDGVTIGALEGIGLDVPDLATRRARRRPFPALDGLAREVWEDIAHSRPRGRPDFRTADVLEAVAALEEGTFARAAAVLGVDRVALRGAAHEVARS